MSKGSHKAVGICMWSDNCQNSAIGPRVSANDTSASVRARVTDGETRSAFPLQSHEFPRFPQLCALPYQRDLGRQRAFLPFPLARRTVQSRELILLLLRTENIHLQMLYC
jgi:hypothetical protein